MTFTSSPVKNDKDSNLWGKFFAEDLQFLQKLRELVHIWYLLSLINKSILNTVFCVSNLHGFGI